MSLPIRTLSVFFPAYYDEDNIGIVVTDAIRVLKHLGLEDYEVTIIEDGSPDSTAVVADELARRFEKVRVIHHPHNLGYGATLKDGFVSARHEWVFYTDGDNQFDIGELPQLIQQTVCADVIVGYRRQKQYSPFRKFTSWCYNLLIRFLFRIKIRDVNCAFKLMPRRLIDEITIDSRHGFIDAEILLQARTLGYRIVQVGVTHRPRMSGVAAAARPWVILWTVYETLRFWLRSRRAILTSRR